jgi:predicted nucleic acid-binding protein
LSQVHRELYVIDASVAIKWFLPDEQFVQQAVGILVALQDGAFSLVCPNHLYYEVGNVLRTSVRRARLTEEEARDALVACLALPISTYGDRELVLRGYDIAQEYDCAAYDGLYLAVASELDCPLIHADGRLRNLLGGRFEHELWIEDVEAPSAS